MKLFGFLSRGHRPDIDALSALVDGALDAQATAALEAHVAGCDVCATELDGLRRVKSMLAALPQVAPTRSFRVRQADVEAAPKPVRAPAGGLLRAMPALAAAAAFVFVAALATDFSTRDSDGARQATSSDAFGEPAARVLEMEDNDFQAGDGDDGVVDNAESPLYEATSAPAAGAVAPDASTDEPADSSTGGGESGADADAPPRGGVAENPAPAPPTTEQVELTASESSEDDDDGNGTTFLIVEVVAAVVALGALALFIVNRRSRSQGQA